jgi:hypothetical protein
MHQSLAHLALAVLIVAGPACDRAKAPETKPIDAKAPADAPKTEPGACDDAHGKALEQELMGHCEVTDEVLTKDVPSVPWKAMPSSAPKDALRVDVTPEGVVLDGWRNPIAFEELSPARFTEERDQVVEMAETYGRPKPEGFVLAIDPHATRSQVAAVFQALDGAGLRQGHLWLATDTPGPLPVPRDAKLLAKVASGITGSGPSDKAVFLGQELQRAVPACPPAEEVFANLAASAVDERCALLARGLSKALVACGCTNEAEILTLVYTLTVGLEAPVRLGTSVPVTLDAKAASLPGSVWSEMVANLDQAKLAVWVSPA